MSDCRYKNMEDFEYSMGNGQCPCCCGLAVNRWWHKFGTHPYKYEDLGHRKDCVLAECMRKAGHVVFFVGEFTEKEDVIIQL